MPNWPISYAWGAIPESGTKMAETDSSVVLINGQHPSVGQHVTFTGAVATNLEIEVISKGMAKERNNIGNFFPISRHSVVIFF